VIVKTIRAHARQFFGVALFWENELNDIHWMVFICFSQGNSLRCVEYGATNYRLQELFSNRMKIFSAAPKRTEKRNPIHSQ
jgi:hypothetical protein